MNIYVPGEQADLLLLQWWGLLIQTGDFDKVFSRAMRPVGTFMSEMRPPTTLLYEADDQGIWFAAWMDQVMQAAFFNLWVREDKRGEGFLPKLDECVGMAFNELPVLVAVVRNPEVVKSALWYGFQVSGEIPHIFDGDTAVILTLTGEKFRTTRRPNGAAKEL